MTFVDPSGFETVGGFNSWYYGAMEQAQAQAQAQSQAMAMAAAQAAAVEYAQAQAQAQAMQAAMAAAAQQAQMAEELARGAAMADQASARAAEQAQAQNMIPNDVTRAQDVAFRQPYMRPVPGPTTGNGLYYVPPMGANWTGWLADNGAGGASSRRDAGSEGTNANGQPPPYAETTPWWLAAAASMTLAPEVTAAIRLWKLSETSWQDFLPDAQKRVEMAKGKYGCRQLIRMPW